MGAASLPRRSRGFTLIELLVTVTIVAIVATIAVISIDAGGGHRLLEREAARFAARFALACDRAALSGRDHGVLFSTKGYVFAVDAPRGWTPEPRGELAPVRWPDGLAVDLRLDGGLVALGDETPERPQLRCDATGEATPALLIWRAGTTMGRQRLRAEGRVERLVLRAREP